MGFKIHKLKGESAFRVLNRFPVTSAETIAKSDPDGYTLMLSSARLTLGLSGNNIIGVSQNKTAKVGNAAGTVYCPFYRAGFYIFKVLQGSLTDNQSAIGAQLDINATGDGLEVGSNNNDVTIVGRHTEKDSDDKWLQFTFNNVDESLEP
jgi:hypothetical protein